MRAPLASLLLTGCVALLLGAQAPLPVDTAIAADADTTRPASQPGVRFGWVDVFIDSGSHALAAYQLELKATRGEVKIVGIEGGEHAAFRAAPYFDPDAMSRDRVILGAFSTARELPAGRTRVARVHVMLTGEATPEYEMRLDVSASSEAKPIPATIHIAQGEAS